MNTMNTPHTFTFTQEQQNAIGRALYKFAELYNWDGRTPRELGSGMLSALLEDLMAEGNLEEMDPVRLSEHGSTVRHMRELLDGIFDPRVMPALGDIAALKAA